MFSFEGNFRSKPTQNYSGTKTNNSADLVQKNRLERKNRELVRRQNECATKIQSFMKGNLVRMAIKRYNRDRFDLLIKQVSEEINQPPNTQFDKSVFLSMLKCFNNFFDSRKDQERLMLCCKLTLTTQLKEEINSWIKEETSEKIYLMGRFLLKIINYLDTLPANTPSSEYTLPFRVLEDWLFLSSFNHSQYIENNMSILQQFLINKGYFRSIAKFIDKQAMQPDIEQYDHSSYSRLPKVKVLLDVFSAPLAFSRNLCNQGDVRNQEFLHDTVRKCLNSVYVDNPTVSYQCNSKIMRVVSGCLADSLSIAELCVALQSSSGSQTNVEPTLGLLHLLCYWYLPSFNQKIRSKPPLTTGTLKTSVLVTLISKSISFLPVPSEKPSYDVTPMEVDDYDDAELDLYKSKMNLEQAEVLSSLVEHGAQLIKYSLTTCDNLESLVEPISQIFDRFLHTQQIPLITLNGYISVLSQYPRFLRCLWLHLSTLTVSRHPSNSALSGSPDSLQSNVFTLLCSGSVVNQSDIQRFLAVMRTFCCIFQHRLLGMHDMEVVQEGSHALGFSLNELIHVSGRLRDLMHALIELAHPDSMPSLEHNYKGVLERMQKAQPGSFEKSFMISDLDAPESRGRLRQWSTAFQHCQRLVSQLHSRDRRLHFCPEQHWLKSSVADGLHLDSHSWLRRTETSSLLAKTPFGYYSLLNPDREADGASPAIFSSREARQLTFLIEMPFVIPFEKRINIFYSLLRSRRENAQGTFNNPHLDQNVMIKVRRTHLYEDAFEKLSQENEPDLHPRIRVEFLNIAGAAEAGIDGGGVFREFLSELLKMGFDPNRGFFIYSEDKTLYPNPEAEALAPNFRSHFFFLGRMLAKMIYEGLLAELSFAQFFLAKVLSRTGGEVDIDFLQSLDSQLYKNLLSLKKYDGDVSLLELDFTVMRNVFDKAEVIELKPDGKNIPVTEDNKIEYIHLMAHYKLNKQIRPHVNAFIAGMNDVVPIDWLRMFDAEELQVLISGADSPIDVEDLRQHTIYLSGTPSDSETVLHFWSVLESMDDSQRRALLKFVTSCSRAPMFGFKELYPSFAIQLVPDSDRLPTSSTCMNLLKLPDFKNPNVLKEKLIYAINSGAGFELS